MKSKSTINLFLFAFGMLTLFFFSPQGAKAQSDEKVYDKVDQMPEYPGGMQALISFIGENLKYPEAAKKNGVSGKVIVSFHVQKDGSVNNAEIIRGIGGGCDEEALRIIGLMEKWSPGKKDGQVVITSLILPINFAL